MIKYALLVLVISFSAQANFNFYKDLSLKPLDVDDFSAFLSSNVFDEKSWPTKVEYKEKNYNVDYTFNENLTKYIKKELRRYSSDYASVVVIDNNSGQILSAIDYTRQTRKFGKDITFSSTNPAASVFKVVTAADLIENTEIDSSSPFTYRGKATTLYKYQLKETISKWTREIPFKKAFALSNNVVFGKAAINNTSGQSLMAMANKFGFNKDNLQLVKMGTSSVFNTNTEYQLAELASGFNRDTMISPVHGAIIASVIANDGVLRTPTLVSEVRSKKWDRVVWQPHYKIDRVFSKKTADDMKELMELTVERGTARSAFRRLKRRKQFRDMKIGGKTGTITGGIPYGKRDWFVSYALPSEKDDKGISVCVMIVNVEKWYIKSTNLAKNIIQHYYTKIAKNQVN